MRRESKTQNTDVLRVLEPKLVLVLIAEPAFTVTVVVPLIVPAIIAPPVSTSGPTNATVGDIVYVEAPFSVPCILPAFPNTMDEPATFAEMDAPGCASAPFKLTVIVADREIVPLHRIRGSVKPVVLSVICAPFGGPTAPHHTSHITQHNTTQHNTTQHNTSISHHKSISDS